MGLFFGVIIFCCCTWWWVRGNAFMAFALSAAALGLVALGADEMYCHSAAIRSAIGVGIACAPYLVRTYLLPRRKQVDLSLIGRPKPYGAGSPRIPG